MKRHLLDAIKVLAVMTVLTGIVYPLFVTLVANVFFSNQATGSLIKVNGRIVGSKLIGQSFKGKEYFWSRPSATDYSALPSGGSNFGPTSDTLKHLVEMRRMRFLRMNDLPTGTRVPSGMLFSSASGLDPDISPRSAELQVARIARARGFDKKQEMELEKLVSSHTQRRQFGLFGEPRVNVLLLNIALDSMAVSRK